MPQKKYICLDCNFVGFAKKNKSGSKKIEIFLWILPLLAPIAILYSIYRRFLQKKVCQNCGSANISVISSELLAQKSLENFHQQENHHKN